MSKCGWQPPTMEPDEWFAIHTAHLADGQSFNQEPFPHPSGNWITIICPCGHRYVTVTSEAES